MDEQFRDLFNKYNKQLKPLVAQIEGHFEKFETPLLENLMVYWENIVLMHHSTPQDYENLMAKANEKLDESISQSYIYMVSAYQKEVKRFEKNTTKKALTCFNNGKFFSDYNKLKKEAKRNIKLTKKTRHRNWNLKHSCPDFIKSYEWNKKTYDACREISNMINEQHTASILYNSDKFSSIWSLIGWITSIGISVLIGIYVKSIIVSLQQWL